MPTQKPLIRKELLLFCADAVAAVGGVMAAMFLRYGAEVPGEHLVTFLAFLPLTLPLRLAAAAAAGAYDFRRRLTPAEHFFAAWGAALFGVLPGYALIGAAQLYGADLAQFSRVVAALDVLLTVAWITTSRALVLAVLFWAGKRVRVWLVGSPEKCARLRREIETHAPRIFEIAGECPPESTGPFGGKPPKRMILAETSLPQACLRDWVVRCDQAGIELLAHPGLDLSLLSQTRVESLAGLPLIPLSPQFGWRFHGAAKRALDGALALIALILMAPLFALTALAVRATSPGPVFFRQERMGQGGKTYMLTKFRTMVEDAEQDQGPALAAQDDPRITPIGRWLRRFRLDELPQLWAVVRGQMSLVGPRPERPEFAQHFLQETPLYERRFLVRPGLTGLAQIHGRYDTEYTQKLRYDLIYINSLSLYTDLRILLATIRIVLTGKGAR